MTTLLIVVAVLFLLNIIIFSAPLQVKLFYEHHPDKKRFQININTFWGLFKVKIKEPDLLIKNRLLKPFLQIRARFGAKVGEPVTEKENITYKFQVTELVEIYKRMHYIISKNKDVVRGLLGATKVSNFYWITGYGFENPAYTGMAYGLIWGVKGIFFKYLQEKVKKVVGRPRFYVEPDFRRGVFSTRISCIFAIRLGHIIIAALKILVRRIFKRG